MDLRNVGSVTLGVTNGGLGGTIELRTGSPTGTLIGTATIGSTGGWDNLVSPTVTLTNKPTGTTTLYAKFVNAAQVGGTPDLLALDWLRFNGAGVKQEPGGTLSAGREPGQRHRNAEHHAHRHRHRAVRAEHHRLRVGLR